jgi:hypothetical protein
MDLQQQKKNGGVGEIRTLEWLSPLHAFQACAFDRSATTPFIEKTEDVCNMSSTHQATLFITGSSFFEELGQ